MIYDVIIKHFIAVKLGGSEVKITNHLVEFHKFLVRFFVKDILLLEIPEDVEFDRLDIPALKLQSI
jgi:hypothetical protein